MIEPSVSGVLRSRYTARRFFALIGFALILTVVLVGIASTFGSGWLRDASLAILTNLAATLTVLMLVYGVWLWVTPLELRNARVSALRPGEIAEILDGLISGASDYWFLGRSGSFFRAAVLPRLDKESQKTRRGARVRIVVPDPVHGDNAPAYASFLQTLGEKADTKTLSVAVVATVLEAARRAVENPYLEVEVGVAPSLPVVRIDISNNGALITRDAKALPGIFCGPGSPYVDMFRSMVDNELRQSRRIRWHPQVDVALIQTAANFAASFDGLPDVDDEVLTRARAMIASPTHRYG